MRRVIPDSVRRPPAPPPQGGRSVLDILLPLQTVTPIIGGGTETREPDPGEPVRVPGLRGALRHLWRAVVDCPKDKLFAREVAIFGGVGLGVGRGPAALRSSLVLTIQVDDPGRIEPAGRHRRLDGDRSGYRALPEWTLGKDLGYALFPLQLDRDERAARASSSPGASELWTHPVRTGLRFTLRAQLRAGAGLGARDEALAAEEVLHALCSLVHFGGVGARTSRGFGALSLQEGRSVEGVDVVWQRRFVPPDRDRLPEWLAALGLPGLAKEPGQRAPVPDPPPWPSLAHARFLFGPADGSVAGAHQRLIGLLRDFRQKPGEGRAHGQRKPEGQSNWPEAGVLRAIREQEAISGGRRPRLPWAHQPEEDLVRRVELEPASLCAPRAAFGLPLIVQFKDSEDQQADATLEYGGSERRTRDAGRGETGARYASPLWLRPLRCQQGAASVVILFPGRPERVRVMYKKKDQGPQGVLARVLAVRGEAPGTRRPIDGYLKRAGGDAALAFLDFLQQKRFVEGRGGSP